MIHEHSKGRTTSRHMVFCLDRSWEHWQKVGVVLREDDGTPMTSLRFEQIREECRRRNWKVIPGCTHINEATGHCAGHPCALSRAIEPQPSIFRARADVPRASEP